MQCDHSMKTTAKRNYKNSMGCAHGNPLVPSPAANNAHHAGNGLIITGNGHHQPPMDRGMVPPDIVGMIMGFQQTQIVATASTLGIFDEIDRAGDPVSAAAVANHLRTNSSATERLMNACVGMKLLNKFVDGKGRATYTNSPTANMCLLKSSARSLRPLLANISEMYNLWGKLLTSVREGSPQTPNKDMFSEKNGFFATGKQQMDFMSAMQFFSKMDAPHVTKAFDLSNYNSLCDLGGGTGALAASMATQYDNMQVTVLELPHMVKAAQHFLQENKPQNLTLRTGDFFNDNLPPADVYMLSHVLHDWGEDKVEFLLERVYNSLEQGGAVLILEKTLTEKKDGPLPTLLFDLNMMLGAEGRERSFSEYKALLEKAGFEDVELKPLPQAPYRDAIIARK